jgi:hypothetical protein
MIFPIHFQRQIDKKEDFIELFFDKMSLICSLRDALTPFFAKRKQRLFLWDLFFVKITFGDPGLVFNNKTKAFFAFWNLSRLPSVILVWEFTKYL